MIGYDYIVAAGFFAGAVVIAAAALIGLLKIAEAIKYIKEDRL